MQFVSPLRYPGGKGRLTQFVADLMEANGLTGGHYVEPYAGGAGVAIALLRLEYASHIHINDLNRSVHAFWSCVLDDTEALCARISRSGVSTAQWKRQRPIQDDHSAEPLDLAFSTFFLNRVNRSGIIRGGVIGGKDQTGHWKLDARYNKADLIDRIQRIADLRHRISLYNLDANVLLGSVLSKVPRRSLVYLDPPYYVKGKGLYEDHYNHDDHLAISLRVARIKQPWIVSYDNVPQIRAMYGQRRCQTFGLRYSAHTRREGAEVVFFSNELTLLDQVRPSRAVAA
jgi:DNA adenine methylase